MSDQEAHGEWALSWGDKAALTMGAGRSRWGEELRDISLPT